LRHHATKLRINDVLMASEMSKICCS